MIKNQKKLGKILSTVTAVSIALQAVLLPFSGNIPVASAATQRYLFSDSGDYTTGLNAQVTDSDVQFNLTWTAQDTDFGGNHGDMDALLSPASAGVVLAVSDGVAYRSTDYGASWSTILGAITVADIVEVTNDGTNNLVAVGDDGGGNPEFHYSDDFGATWTDSGASLGVVGEATSATYDATDNQVFASLALGRVAISSDGGVNWALTSGATSLVPVDRIIQAGDDRLVVSGTQGGQGTIRYSDDDGANWSSANLGFSTTGVKFYTLGYHNGDLFVAAQDILLRASASAALSSNESWITESDDIGDGSFTITNFYGTGDFFFASVYESDAGNDGTIYSRSATAGSFGSWFPHTVADATSGGLGIVRLYSDERFLWLVNDGGTMDAYLGDPYTSNAWVIPNDPVIAAEIYNVTMSFPAYTESTDVSVAFGFTADSSGTWYYHDGSKWTSGTGTNSSNATLVSELNPVIINSFNVEVGMSGPLYFRIYLVGGSPSPDPPLIAVRYLDLEYSTQSTGSGSSGGGPDGPDNVNDNTPPFSDVVDLTGPYLTAPTLEVEATDNKSGVANATLYYTKEAPAQVASDLIAYQNSKTGCPTDCFKWSFNAPLGDGQYYFYSSAVDNAGNNNFADKFENLEIGEQITYEAEAFIDLNSPTVIYHQPDQNELEVPVSGSIQLDFSEVMNVSTIDYNFYKMVGSNQVSALGKLGALQWNPENDGLVVNYSELEYETKYYFTIRHLEDAVGHDLVKNSFEQPDNIPVWMLKFTSVEKLDPDLTQSKIEITNKQAGGKYKTGDKVSFKTTLINASDLPALVTAEMPIGVGLDYCSTNGCEAAKSSAGQAPTVQIDGDNVIILWSGTVAKGAPVTITFDTRVEAQVNNLLLTQYLDVDDGVNSQLRRFTIVEIEDQGNLSTSTKTGTCLWMGINQLCTDAVIGTEITYTITLTNTGHTPTNRTVNDGLGQYLTYVSGPSGTDWKSLGYNSISKVITGSAYLLPGQSVSMKFSARFKPSAEGLDVTNVADISNWSPDPSFATHVPGASEPEQFPPVIVAQSPTNQSFGVGLREDIEVVFSKSIDTTSFGYQLRLGDKVVDTSTWNFAWYADSGMANSKVVISHGNTPFEISETYTVEVDRGTTDLDGNALAQGELPNPWTFTVVSPVVKITKPVEDPIKMELNTVSPSLVASIHDLNTGAPYVVEQDVQLGVLAEIPATGKAGSKRQISYTAQFSTNPNQGFTQSTEFNIWHFKIAKNNSEATFYFKESAPNIVKLVAFPDPWNGWAAGIKNAIVGDVEINESENLLVIEASSSNIKVGQFSSPITIKATGAEENSLLLPDRLYFYTQSETGAFYDANFRMLPEYVTIQANPTTKLQFINTTGESATVYYKDSVAQSSLITVSDNAPLSPDIDFVNADAILNITDEVIEEEEIIEELEEVEDETGRILTQLVLEPDYAVVLPGGIKSFKVTAYDQDNAVIENAKFKWYVVAGGGTIEKNGINGDSQQSIFTAGQDLGLFQDTVLVATIFNGEFGFATADIKVSDIVDMDGPQGLPTTGVNSLQLLFMALTLLAAVGLAWVEHYDKTHLEEGQS